MKGNLGDPARLKHIIDAVDEIEGYLIGVDLQHFLDNSMIRFACIKQLEIIGEAANHLSEELRSTYIQVKWRQIIGLRNILIHEYFGVDFEVVWNVLQNDLPEFKQNIKKIISSYPL